MAPNNVSRRDLVRRLQLIVPWLNGDQGPQRLAEFCARTARAHALDIAGDFGGVFDGLRGASRAPLRSARAQARLRDQLGLFAEGGWSAGLEVLVEPPRRDPPKRTAYLAPARRRALADAAGRVYLRGDFGDVLLFCWALTLAHPMASVTLTRCPAPCAPRTRRERQQLLHALALGLDLRPERPGWGLGLVGRCNRWVLASLGRGRPAEYCSAACRRRVARWGLQPDQEQTGGRGPWPGVRRRELERFARRRPRARTRSVTVTLPPAVSARTAPPPPRGGR